MAARLEFGIFVHRDSYARKKLDIMKLSDAKAVR